MINTIREPTMLKLIIGMLLLCSYVMSNLCISRSVATWTSAQQPSRRVRLAAIVPMVVCRDSAAAAQDRRRELGVLPFVVLMTLPSWPPLLPPIAMGLPQPVIKAVGWTARTVIVARRQWMRRWRRGSAIRARSPRDQGRTPPPIGSYSVDTSAIRFPPCA